ncbi:MAG TPA: 5-formyltetrahydrofolate cyclo-ligase [Firmicutes bacterium]|jgi:5-formyltetrahydrofolate cyclo-ligase|nr:5-formyltetrahydrofolate cyclo-ligase [Bacillota bacterium]HAA37409.1 5-formyltetrahydrofolate cyclo-ligase [Bacillota bacterium]
MLDKKSLRKKVLAARDSLTWDQVEANSVKIAEQLFALPQYRAAQTIMYFLNFGKEVLTMKMVPQTLAHGKRAVATKTVTKERRMILSEIYDLEADLEPGLWGIPEPKAEALRPLEPTEIDFVIVPGVAFDLQGNRLGYGGGYYDRFFPQLREGVPLVAVTFELQIVKEVPVDPWDRRVDFIITEKRVIDCR